MVLVNNNFLNHLNFKKFFFYIYSELLLLFTIFENFNGTKKLFGSGNSIDFSDISNLTKLFGNSDFGEVIKFGVILAENSSVINNDSTRIWMQLAPPGQGTLNAIIIKLFGLNNFGIVYLFFIFLMWSLLFLLLTFVLNQVNLFTFLLMSLLITSSMISDWILGIAIFGTEATSFALFFIFVVFLYYLLFIQSNFKQKSIYWNAFFLGVLVIFATSIRAQFIILLYLSFIILVISLMFYLYLFIINDIYKFHKNSKVFNIFKINFLTLLTMLSFFYPYSIFSKNQLNINFGSVNVQNIHFKNAWMKEENLDPGTPLMGFGWACKIDPVKCEEISQYLYIYSYEDYRNPTLQTVFRYPFRFMENRLEVFSRAWFSSDKFGAIGNYDSIPYGLFILFLLIYLLYIYMKKDRNIFKLIFFIIISSVLLLPYLFAHVEIRYLGAIKIFIFISLILELSKNKKELSIE